MKASEAGIELGSVVKLKSGGPKMTVSEIYNQSEWVKCYFFKENETCEELPFPVFTLQKLELA